MFFITTTTLNYKQGKDLNTFSYLDLTVFDSYMGIDTALACRLEVTVMTAELGWYTTLKPQVTCHTVPV